MQQFEFKIKFTLKKEYLEPLRASKILSSEEIIKIFSVIGLF